MELYIGIILLLVLFSFFDLMGLKRSQKTLFMIIIFFLFVFQDGLRWETGSDWQAYRIYFESFASYGNWRAPFEIGYKYLNYIVYFFSNNYSAFLIIHAIIIYSLYLKSINDYTMYPLVTSLCFYFLFFGYMMGMNRQGVAIAICVFSLRYVTSRESIKFFALILIASLFHFSAMIFSIAYFLNKKIKAHFYIMMLMLAVILNPFIQVISQNLLLLAQANRGLLGETVVHYIGAGGDPNSAVNIIMGLIKRFFVFIMVYLNLDKLEQKIPKVGLMLNLYFVSIVFYILFNNNIQIYVGRGNLYFGILFEAFLLPCLIFMFIKERNRSLMYFFVLVIIIFVNASIRPIFGDNFTPYKGIFINTEYSRETMP